MHKFARELKTYQTFTMAGTLYRVVRTYLELDDPEMMILVFCNADGSGRDFRLTLPKDTLFFLS